MKKEPLKRKDLVDNILLDKWNKKWGRAIVMENGKSFVYQVKKTWRGKYVVCLERNKSVDYKIFYERFKYKGLLKRKENIIAELRNRYEVLNKSSIREFSLQFQQQCKDVLKLNRENKSINKNLNIN